MSDHMQYGSGRRQPDRPETERSNAPIIMGERSMTTLPIARGNATLPQAVAYLEKRDAASNMQRYYRIIVVPTLFGEWAMVREWGRIGRRGGNQKETWFADEADARHSGAAIATSKRRRGYQTAST